MAQYGWVQRYPAGKEAITGIGHEPWHFRYVGQPHATLMAERDLTLEEYIAWIRAFPSRIRRYRHGNVTLSFLPAAPQGPTVVDLPEEGRAPSPATTWTGSSSQNGGGPCLSPAPTAGWTPFGSWPPCWWWPSTFPFDHLLCRGGLLPHPVPGPGGGSLLLHGHRPLRPGAGAGGQAALPLGRQVRKILLLYLVAVVLYLPIGWYAGHYQDLSLLDGVRLLVFDGTFYHLWYFPACAMGLLVVVPG